MRVAIEGRGIAGLATAILLARQRIDVTLIEAEDRPPSGRVVALPAATVELLAAVWGISPADLPGARPALRRRVRWSSTASLETVPADGLVCELGALERALAGRLEENAIAAREEPGPIPQGDGFRILARGRCAGEAAWTAGRRVAIEGIVATGGDLRADETLVAAISRGWLFGALRPDGRAAVALVCPAEFASSNALADAVQEIWPGHGNATMPLGMASAAPAFVPRCAEEGLLRVGDAALAVDPLRGDGVGHGLRTSLLAAAVLGAIRRGEDRAACFAHYRGRIDHVFRAHVGNCLLHYERAFNAPLWAAECVLMSASLAALPAPAPLSARMVAGELTGLPAHT